jgi:hypothetical protein
VLTRKCPEYTGVLQKQVEVGKTAMLADAQVCSSSKRTQYAQQKSCEGSEAPVIIESTENYSDHVGYSTQNRANLTAILAALDSEELKQLLNQIQQK